VSAHTKGPWAAQEAMAHGTNVIGPNGVTVAFCGTNSAFSLTETVSIRKDEAHANAALMAAAPDLLDEVRGLMRYLENVAPLLDGDAPESGVRSMIERARAAIAKAEGRS
jgi:hypothetical protein